MNTPRNPNNNPAINPDDPKWTAYVLGEVSDAERHEIEHLLEISEEARALVEELTLATETLKEELTPNTTLMMSAEQRAAIRTAAEPTPRRWFEVFPSRWGLGLAAAALVVFAVVLPVAWNRNAEQETFSAANISVAEKDSRSLQTSKDSDRAANEAAEKKDGADKFADKAQDKLAQTESAAAMQQKLQNVVREQKEAAAFSNLKAEPQATIVAPVMTPQQVAQNLQGIPATPAPAFNSPAPNVGAAVNPDRVQELPLTTNNASDLLQLMPGVAGTPPPPPPAAAPAAREIQISPSVPAQQTAAGRGNGGGGGGAGGRGGGRGGAAAASAAPQSLAQGTIGGIQGGGVVRDGLSVNDSRLAKAAAPPPAPPVGARLDRANVAPNTEAYDPIIDNPFIRTTQENLATFSIDVDTAAYANVRRFLNLNQLPPRDAVRIEELVNYFNYDYAQPSGNAPVAPNMEVAAAPWSPSHRLVRIGIKAREVNADRRPPSNLVFLIDVSGSMNSAEKLPLVKAGLNMLVERLGENDMVSMVVYAGNSGLVLAPTSGTRKEVIRQAIDRLEAGGSTNGGAGIQLAYNQATANFLRNGVNRVILMTDGDFNVGVTNQSELTRLIQDRAKSGVFLSVLGFGMGNIKDSTLERLADQGNGIYAYIDNLTEARKVLVEEMSGTLFTVAKDVKIQVDFNPAKVEAYRLIGYENRLLRTQDFNNDAKDAGDMGAGHTVTALFEIVPKGGEVPGPSIDPSKYTQPAAAASAATRNAGSSSEEMLTLRVRYKQPDSDTSQRMDVPLVDRGNAFPRASTDFRFAAAVAEFGMILRDSPFKGTARMDSVLDIAEGSRGADRNGYRAEFLTLVQKAKNLGR